VNNDLRKALDFDPIHEAEQLAGKTHHGDDSVVWLGMALGHKQRETTDALLFLNRDTNSWSQTREQWEAVVLEIGFELVLCLPIETTRDFYRIYWKPGLLLCTDSYNNDTVVNGATCYFNYQGPREAMHKCSSGPIKGSEDIWSGSRDGREGLRFALDEMSQQGQLLPTWIARPHLWLLHYMDTKVEGYDWKAITKAMVEMLPAHVQQSITP